MSKATDDPDDRIDLHTDLPGQSVIPPIRETDIVSEVTTEYENEGWTFQAHHEYHGICSDMDYAEFTDKDHRRAVYTDLEETPYFPETATVRHEYRYHDTTHDEIDGYIALYRWQTYEDFNGTTRSGYRPFFCPGDEDEPIEELPVVEGVVCQKSLQSWEDENGEYQSEWVYDPYEGHELTPRQFAIAHHFGERPFEGGPIAHVRTQMRRDYDGDDEMVPFSEFLDGHVAVTHPDD